MAYHPHPLHILNDAIQDAINEMPEGNRWADLERELIEALHDQADGYGVKFVLVDSYDDATWTPGPMFRTSLEDTLIDSAATQVAIAHHWWTPPPGWR